MDPHELDRVDAILDHLRGRDPQADLTVKAVHIRLRRVSHWLETESRRRLAPQGIEFWELPLLSNLIRAGGSLAVGRLQDLAQLTSGAITQRITKLEAAGVVERTVARHDRRQVDVQLTEAGRARFEHLVDAVGEVERELFGAIDPALVAALSENLRAFMLATEGALPADPGSTD